MNEQQFQHEVMDELRQMQEEASQFLAAADDFLAKMKQAKRDAMPDPIPMGTQTPVSSAIKE